MKTLLILLALLLTFPCAYADDDDDSGYGRGCTYIGSWLGYNSDEKVAWTSQANGMQSSHGTMLLEIPFDPATFNGSGFNAVALLSNLKGEWKRIGHNTFYYRAASFAYNADGDAEWLAKLTGTATVTGDECDVVEIDDTVLSIYFSDADHELIDDGLFYQMQFGSHKGYRIRNDLP